MELLVTMGLLGLMLGTGVGVLVNLDLEAQRTPTVARSVLAAARSRAASEGQAVHVLVEDEGRELVLRAPRVVGSFSFEAGARGLRGTSLVVEGARRVDDGYLGSGLTFSGGGNTARARVDLTAGSFDPLEGFALRLWVRASDDSGGTVLDLGGIVRLETREGGRLLASLTPEGTSRVDLETPPGSLVAGTWVELGLAYDRVRFTLTVDGFPHARQPLGTPLARTKGDLVLGGRPRPFPGVIDELVIWTYERGTAVALADERRWPGDAPERISFDSAGALDPLEHESGLELTFAREGGEADVLMVGRYGVTR